MSGATETRPLLQDTAEHEDYQSTSTIVQDEVEELEAPARISRIDLIWVLTGLWSAVFLGALDGSSVPSASGYLCYLKLFVIKELLSLRS